MFKFTRLKNLFKPIEKNSDGFHTFDELYDFREAYNAAFFNSLPKNGFDVHKSLCHSDGEKCFGGGWFIVMAELPTGQISNHYEMKYWNDFQIEERATASIWDGHTPKEALLRIQMWNKYRSLYESYAFPPYIVFENGILRNKNSGYREGIYGDTIEYVSNGKSYKGTVIGYTDYQIINTKENGQVILSASDVPSKVITSSKKMTEKEFSEFVQSLKGRRI